MRNKIRVAFGIVTAGITIAIVAAAGFGIVLTALSGHLVGDHDGYHYVMSFIPWVLGAGLIMGQRILQK